LTPDEKTENQSNIREKDLYLLTTKLDSIRRIMRDRERIKNKNKEERKRKKEIKKRIKERQLNMKDSNKHNM
jgi:hypothetical protein